jgi:prolyl 4-hydroxylase
MDKLFNFIQEHKKTIVLILIVICFIIVILTSLKQHFSPAPSHIIPKAPSTINNNLNHPKYKEIILSENPKIIYIENFITPEDAIHLMKLADEIKKPSTIDTQDDPYTLVTDVRSSESAHLGKARDNIIKRIEDDACAYVGLDTHYLEPMQVVVYEKGQKFNPHYDFFNPNTSDIKYRGNRNKTILVYLNDIKEEFGGATVFPKINLRIQPKAYSAIYFENMNGSELDYNTLHAGEVLNTDKIKKYAINIWFREKPSW